MLAPRGEERAEANKQTKQGCKPELDTDREFFQDDNQKCFISETMLCGMIAVYLVLQCSALVRMLFVMVLYVRNSLPGQIFSMTVHSWYTFSY